MQFLRCSLNPDLMSILALRSFFRIKGGGGVQAFNFGKNDFELGVGRDRQDTSRHFEGSFRSHTCNTCPCEASEQKPESELKVNELSYCHHSICL